MGEGAGEVGGGVEGKNKNSKIVAALLEWLFFQAGFAWKKPDRLHNLSGFLIIEKLF